MLKKRKLDMRLNEKQKIKPVTNCDHLEICNGLTTRNLIPPNSREK